MNADEIVREARGLHADWMAYESMHHGGGRGAKSDDGEAKRKFMLWIESLQAQLSASQSRAQDARNELCLKCGWYRDAHKGACDGCRWKEK